MAYRKSVLTYTLGGAVGFGIGAAIGATTAVGPMAFLFLIMGALGGAAIGSLLGKQVRVVFMALAGAVGFGIGSLPVLAFAGLGIGSGGAMSPIDIIMGATQLFVFGALQGLIGGASLGLSFKSRRARKYLMVGSALGFGIGAQTAWGLLFGLTNVLVFAIWGAIGGAALGTALGYIEKMKMRSRQDMSKELEQTGWTSAMKLKVGIFLNLALLIIDWVVSLNVRIGYYKINEITGMTTPTGVTEFRMPYLIIFIVLICVTIGLNILMTRALIKAGERRYAIILGVLGLLVVLVSLIGLSMPPALMPE